VVLSCLLTAWPGSIEAKQPHDGSAPLHYAAYSGHLAIVKMLLDAGANVEPTDKDSSTPLHDCCERGHAEIAEVLLHARANPLSIGRFGDTPLHRSVYNNRIPVLRLLLTIQAVVDNIDYKSVLQRSSDGTRPDSTALRLAITNGSEEAGRMLLEAGARLEVRACIWLLLWLPTYHNQAANIAMDDATAPGWALSCARAMRARADACKVIDAGGAHVHHC
jgi:ankyrin repeat protein